MGLETASNVGDPPLPLASGTWVKAAGSAAIRVRSEAPTGDELWLAINRFHVLAMECIRLRLTSVAEMESRRLADRTNLAAAKAHELFSDLAAVIVPQSQRVEYEEQGAGPLFGACRAAGDATGVAIVQPPGRRLTRHDFSDVLEIARASRLRMRQTLLRPNWWRWNVGPLIAWRGEARRPVALIPMSRRYVMLEPGSPGRRIVDQVTSVGVGARGRDVLSDAAVVVALRMGFAEILHPTRSRQCRPTSYSVYSRWVFSLWRCLSSPRRSSIP